MRELAAVQGIASRLGSAVSTSSAGGRSSAYPFPWPQRRKSRKLRWPPYKPNHSEPFRDPLDYSKEDWARLWDFIGSRRQLAFVDLSPKLREKLTAKMPALIAYFDARRLSPAMVNRSHTVLDLSAGQKPAPTPATQAPADSLSHLERALAASIERARSGA